MSPSLFLIPSIIPCISAIFVLIVFYPVLTLEYVWDDWQLFINSPMLRIPDLVWQGMLQPILPGTTYFRPLPLGTFALEFNLYGIDPQLSHAINLVLHGLNTALVALIAKALTTEYNVKERTIRILVAALLYGLHPALIEPVAWVSGRFDLMVTAFVLIGILAYLNLHGNYRDFWVATCFLLAFLSKEMAVTFPALIFLFYLGRKQSNDLQWKLFINDFFQSKEWRLYMLLIALEIFVFGIRYFHLGQMLHKDPNIEAAFRNPLDHLAFVGHTIGFYIKMTFWPISDLNPQHPFDPDTDLTWTTRISGALTVLFAAALVGFVLTQSRTWSKLMGVGWLIALLPVLNIIPLTIGNNIGHERFLTLPLAFVALSACLIKWPKLAPSLSRTLTLGIGLGAGMLWFISIANIRITIPLWQNEWALWSWAYAKHPDFPFIQSSYIQAAIHYGNWAHAQSALEKVERQEGGLPYNVRSIKGHFLLKTGKPTEAIAEFKEALRVHEFLSSFNLGLEDVKTERMDSSFWFYRLTYSGSAAAYLDLSDYEQALSHVKILLFHAPYFPQGWLLKALALYGLGQWEEGNKAFAQAEYYFVPVAKQEAKIIRNNFLEKLCQNAMTEHETCKNLAKIL